MRHSSRAFGEVILIDGAVRRSHGVEGGQTKPEGGGDGQGAKHQAG